MMESLVSDPAETYYNLLVRGFRSGRLSLEKNAPAALARLPDPYDPAANFAIRTAPGGVHDLSYYRGGLFLYFGVTPALVLFWPYVALTGHYLWHRQAAAIFCAVGFLASLGLFRALQRRYFGATGAVATAACTLILGLTTGIPLLLSRSEVYEVAISCGYMLTMLALAAVWRALHEPGRRGRWLAAAGAAFGLAAGARPLLLFCSVVLVVPILAEPALDAAAGSPRRPRSRGESLRLAVCALGPIALIGLGLLLYNHLRFGRALEFGQHYQLAGDRQDTARHFSPTYLPFNFRVYFLEPARWTDSFPFVERIAPPALPAGHAPIEDPFGALPNIPVLALALFAPLGWRGRAEDTGALRGFALAVGAVFAICALILCAFYGSCSRYEVEFLPALALLAVLGLLGMDRALADLPSWRFAAGCGLALLLSFSVGFNLLGAVEHYAEARNDLGIALTNAGRAAEAVRIYGQVLRLKPGMAAGHVNLGDALMQLGRGREALGEYEAAARLDPAAFDARQDLANALIQEGRYAEAIDEAGQALRLRPDSAQAYASMGYALARLGRLPEAIESYGQALRLKPDYSEVHNNLGNALVATGRLEDAVDQFEQVLGAQGDNVDAHDNLGLVLAQMGRNEEARVQFAEVLRLKPDYPGAHFRLASALANLGRLDEAIAEYEAALRSNPRDAEAHYNLAMALRMVGRMSEAQAHFDQAARLQAGR